MTPSSISRPGVMLEVFGQGVLLQGTSGVGKSDLALALVERGHHLIADDLVEFSRKDDGLFGSCRAGFEGFMEVTGLGVINLARLFGDRAVKRETALDLVLTLDTVVDDYDRLQPLETSWQLLGVSLPNWHIPYANQRNLPLIVETAVRLNAARRQGYDANIDFKSRLNALMREGAA